MQELLCSGSNSNPEAPALTTVDLPPEKGVLIVVVAGVTVVGSQVMVAAVVLEAAPGRRGQEVGESLADSSLRLPLPQSRNCVSASEVKACRV